MIEFVFIPVRRTWSGAIIISNRILHDTAHSVSSSPEGSLKALEEFYTACVNPRYAAAHIRDYPLEIVQRFTLKRIVPRTKRKS